MSTPVAETALDERLCLALYNASRAMTARYRPLLSELDLTYPQYLVMLALWEDGHATVGQLGERLRLDSGTLSPLLRRLETAGFVDRSRNPADERTTVVTLTARGRRLRRRAAHVPAEMCEATGLDPAAQREIVSVLQALVQQLG